MPNVRSFRVLPSLPEELKDLEILARNMFWCWNLDFVRLFKRIDSNLWKACGYNPVRLLGSVSQEKLSKLEGNHSFLCELKRAKEKLQTYLDAPTWFQRSGNIHSDKIIAYFSAEFGIHECLPIYSGGLGVLAGDHLKTASDMGLPLVGVGLLYQNGFFRQYLNIDGWQQEAYVTNDFYNMPAELVRDEKGKPVMISIEYPEEMINVQIWKVNVGRVSLYLLDANLDTNSANGRVITSSLYGGDNEMRIRQEIMLGIGGLRALRAVGIEPAVCHMNEGHAAFMALERIRVLMQEKGLQFDEALEATKAGNVFTVHTPVKAGNDEFSPELIDKYLGNYIKALKISEEQFMALGRVKESDHKESFKMPVLAIRLSSYRNGVSKLHGQVTRNMWSVLWPDIPVDEVPISSITNGVHIKSWLSEDMNALYERYLGPNWCEESIDSPIWNNIDSIPDEELWRPHQRSKVSLIAFARERLKAQMQRRGTFHSELNWAEEVLDPEALTIGFARRFATYKRGDLLLKDPKRLIKLLTDKEKPVQIVFAGKAHPRDTEGKEIIRRIIHFANQYGVRRRIVFLEDYEMNIARYMVRGVDIWLNTPRRPMEASGTSGMKAAFNGALNMSTYDGWWCEGYTSNGGWIIGAGEDYDDLAYQDMVESQAMYKMLENEIVPLFYRRSADSLPRGWIQRMRNSIKYITPRFSTYRMLTDYVRKCYEPAGEKWQRLNEKEMARAKNLSKWNAEIKKAWSSVSVKNVLVNIDGQDGTGLLRPNNPSLKVGSKLKVKAEVELGDIKPDDIAVQLYNGPVDAWGKINMGSTISMVCQNGHQGGGTKHWFETTIACESSGQLGLTVRVVPKNEDMASSWEPCLVHWEGQSES
ncbi:MAG: alpha-glucan family phosphorylase [Sedimentisphaerales bacterium]|nr:alpha-glucan family phosphorylase [Sedimentisphaerales bacterium]